MASSGIVLFALTILLLATALLPFASPSGFRILAEIDEGILSVFLVVLVLVIFCELLAATFQLVRKAFKGHAELADAGVRPEPKLPTSYGIRTLLWGGLFILLVVYMLCDLSLSPMGIAREALEAPRNPGDLPAVRAAIKLIIMTPIIAVYLLATAKWLFIGRRTPEVAQAPPKTTRLGELVDDCAGQRACAAPGSLKIAPDADIASRSSGYLGSIRGRADTLRFGAILSTALPEDDLRCAVHHELAHLYMRKNHLTVNMLNRIYEYVPGVTDAWRKGMGYRRWLVIPYWLLHIYRYSVCACMAASHRDEELVADYDAAQALGRQKYSESLARLLVVQLALSARGQGGEPSLIDVVNARFYDTLLETDPSNSELNWFALARTVLGEHQELYADRVSNAYEAACREGRSVYAVHPSPQERLQKLGSDMSAYAGAMPTQHSPTIMDEQTEKEYTTEMVRENRTVFYEAKSRCGGEPFTPWRKDSRVEYYYLGESLTITDDSLTVSSDGRSRSVPWGDVTRIVTLRGTTLPDPFSLRHRIYGVNKGYPYPQYKPIRLVARSATGLSHLDVDIAALGQHAPEAKHLVEYLWSSHQHSR